MKKYIFENIKNVLLGALLVSTSTTATAATTGNFSIGASYFSMGMIDRVSSPPDHSAGRGLLTWLLLLLPIVVFAFLRQIQKLNLSLNDR